MPVGVAVPLQRHPPALMTVVWLAELGAFAAFVALDQIAAFAVLALIAGAVVGLAATNRKRVLAVGRDGVFLLSASRLGRPTKLLGPAPKDLTLPVPAGLGTGVQLGPDRWWVDRSAFPRLVRARALLEADRQDQRGKGEDDAGADGDSVEVALHDR
jgi:hypothetical protein